MDLASLQSYSRRFSTKEGTYQPTLHGVCIDYFRIVFCLHSEEDLERALGAYAKLSHSSTAVFLDSSSKPDSTTPTAAVTPTPTGSSSRTRAVLKTSASEQILRNRENGTAVSAVKRQDSTMSIRSIGSMCNDTKENLPSQSAAPARYTWLKEQAVEDDSLTSALPKYSKDMLESSDLPLSSKASLDELTRSLRSMGKGSTSTANWKGRGRMRTTSATARFVSHNRSPSVQSLVSTTSSVDSGTHWCSVCYLLCIKPTVKSI